MSLNLGNFVMEDSVKITTKKLIDSENDTKAFNILKEISTIGELRKLRVFISCQKRDIGNNFTAIAIYISTIALLLPAFERLFINFIYIYIVLSASLALGLGAAILKDGVSLINKTNETNSKIEYLLWLVDEEISSRYTLQ